MDNSSFERPQLRDLAGSLMLWGVAEFVGFLLFPALNVVSPGPKLRVWFMWSIPLGLGGALLIAFCSYFTAKSSQLPTGNRKDFFLLMSSIASWLGLAGILYPLIVSCTHFFTTMKLPK